MPQRPLRLRIRIKQPAQAHIRLIRQNLTSGLLLGGKQSRLRLRSLIVGSIRMGDTRASAEAMTAFAFSILPSAISKAVRMQSKRFSASFRISGSASTFASVASCIRSANAFASSFFNLPHSLTTLSASVTALFASAPKSSDKRPYSFRPSKSPP